MKNSEGAVSVTIPHNKNAPRRGRKSHEKYEIRISYFSCKYEYKKASQTDKHRDTNEIEHLLFTTQQYYD